MKPPTLRALTAELRELHAAFAHPESGGEFVCLARTEHYDSGANVIHIWELRPVSSGWPELGREYIPGDREPFDAEAAARRLLAALGDATRPNEENPASRS